VPALQFVIVLLLAGVLGAVTIQQARQWSSEMALYRHGIEVAPRNPLVLNHMAMLLVKESNDLKAAHELGERALAEAPDEYETLLAAGILRGNIHDEDGALPLLLHAQQLQPERHDPYLYLGMIYLDKGHLTDAETALRQAVRLAPNEPDQHFLLGYALERQDRLAEARSEYQAELQIRPGSTRAAQRLAAVNARLSKQGNKN
jgi:Flp pilus assembly protein TadD